VFTSTAADEPHKVITINEATFKQLVGNRELFYNARDGLTVRGRKKLDERVLLERIYRDREVVDVAWRERPDFAVRCRHGGRPFGVEVCRYYDSQSEARLRETPGYTGHLLAGGAVWHKDDITGLSVTTISIQDANGRTIATDEPAIFRQKSPIAAVVDGVRSAILDKERVFPVEDNLSHVNLIVEERTGSLGTITSSDFYLYFGRPSNADAVFRSQFREIFLVTRFTTGPMYVPLKLLFTLARLHFFHNALAESLGDEHVEMYDYMALFAGHLRTITVGPVGIREEANTGEVLYGDTGFIVAQDAEGLQTTIRMYRDAAWPPCLHATAASSPLALRIHARALEVAAQNTFASPIAFPVFEL